MKKYNKLDKSTEWVWDEHGNQVFNTLYFKEEHEN